MKKALFIRLDRMGDLVLTLPVDHILNKDYQVQWVIPKGLEFVAENSQPKRSFYALKKQFSFARFFAFYRFVRRLKADVSISFHVPWWVNAILYFAGIPQRGGVLSQWHSYLFLNKGLRQKRSQVEYHEMEYNYLLVEKTLGLPCDSSRWQPLKMTAPPISLPIDVQGSYCVVHPGMGGSALNWPIPHYKNLIEELSKKTSVVVTGTKNDKAYLDPLKEQLIKTPNIIWADQKLNGPELLTLLHQADAVLAPSTGVIHLSSSLGAPSLGVYSPVAVHQAKRWGPKGEKTTVFSPAVQCPAHFDCLGSECSQYDCMASIQPEQILNSLAK